MAVRSLATPFVLAALAVLLGLGPAGCDYWPPALQSQIEQLRVELQMAAAERTRLETQVRDAVRGRDELQMQVDELTRINRELTKRVASLEQSLAVEREKVAKLAKGPKPAAKTPAKRSPTKAPQKKAGKAQGKKKTTTGQKGR